MTAPASRPLVLSTASDAPLRQPARAPRRPDIRIEAGRQLRASLWLVLVMGVGILVTIAARPAPQAEAFAAPGKTMALGASAPLTLTASVDRTGLTAIR
jgi:hypothetical protein